ncbi:MAG: MFS transporter [Ornithinimicrobium sp.]
MVGEGVSEDADGPGSPGPLGRGFWQLWSASTLSNLADGIVKIALPLVAVTLTDSPALVAGVGVAVTLPWLLFALPAGALADRVDRRRAMLAANAVRATSLVAMVVAVLLGSDTIWVLYAVALFVGTAETIHDTSAQSILPQIVPRQQLSRANGRLYATELTANEFIGPPLGGLLVAVGAATAFASPAALWVVAVGMLLLLRGNFRVPRKHKTSLGADVAAGLRFLWRQNLLRTLAVMTGLFNVATNATFAVFVLYAVGPNSALGLSEVGYGVLFAAIAGGALGGSLVAERVEKHLGRARTLGVGILGGALIVTAPAVTAAPTLIALGFFFGGTGMALFNVVAVSLRQSITPDHILGRVNSGYRLFGWGTRPLGAAIGGLVAEAFGLRAVFGFASALILLTLVGMVCITDTAIAAAEESSD